MMKLKYKHSGIVESVFDFDLRSHCIQIMGDTSTGKSWFYQNVSMDKQFICFNYQNYNIRDSFVDIIEKQRKRRGKELKYVVIDNADSLMTDELIKYILNDDILYYLLFGRGVMRCVTNMADMCRLKRQCIDDTHFLFTLDYYLKRSVAEL